LRLAPMLSRWPFWVGTPRLKRSASSSESGYSSPGRSFQSQQHNTKEGFLMD